MVLTIPSMQRGHWPAPLVTFFFFFKCSFIWSHKRFYTMFISYALVLQKICTLFTFEKLLNSWMNKNGLYDLNNMENAILVYGQYRLAGLFLLHYFINICFGFTYYKTNMIKERKDCYNQSDSLFKASVCRCNLRTEWVSIRESECSRERLKLCEGGR